MTMKTFELFCKENNVTSQEKDYLEAHLWVFRKHSEQKEKRVLELRNELEELTGKKVILRK